MKRFIHRGDEYTVIESKGDIKTDGDFVELVGKKVGGRKKVNVKINKYNGLCIEL